MHMEATEVKNSVPLSKGKKRLAWPDLVKFFAMVLVVIGHVIRKFTPLMLNTPFYNYVWLVQIPLFMLISGFFIDARKGLTFREFLKATYKNTLRLLLPTFSFIFVTTLVFRENSGNLQQTFSQFFNNPESSLWFLWVLFFILLIFNIGRLFVRKNKIIYTLLPFFLSFGCFALLLIYLFLTKFEHGNFLGIKLLTYYLPIFCIGSFARIISSVSWVKHLAFKIPLFLTTLAFTLFMIFYFDSIYTFPDTKIFFVALRVLGSLSASYSTIKILIFLSDKFGELQTISKLGRYSLETYYLHIIFLRYLPIDYIESEFIFKQILSVTQISSILLIATFLVILLTRFVPFVHFVLFGKSNSRYKFETDIYNRIINII